MKKKKREKSIEKVAYVSTTIFNSEIGTIKVGELLCGILKQSTNKKSSERMLEERKTIPNKSKDRVCVCLNYQNELIEVLK